MTRCDRRINIPGRYGRLFPISRKMTARIFPSNVERAKSAMDDNISRLNAIYSSTVLPNTVLMSVGIMVGVIGNITVIVLYVVRINDKRGDRYFIPILALVDCLGSVSNGVFYVIDNFYIFSFPSEILCRVLLFSLTFTSGFSGHVLGAVAFQRYLLLCHPYGKQLTLFRRRLLVIGITFVCVIYGAPLLVISGIKTSQKTFQNQSFSTNICVFDVNPNALTLVYFGSFLLLTLANVVTTSTLYALIMRTIYKTLYSERQSRGKIIKSMKNDKNYNKTKDGIYTIYKECADQDEKSRKKSVGGNSMDSEKSGHGYNVRTKMNVMFLTIILLYILSYIPSIGILILTYTLNNFYYLQLPGSLMNVWIFFARFLLLNHVINPFIYGYFDVKFRSELKHLCCKSER